MAKRSCAAIQDISNYFRPKTKSVKYTEPVSEGLLNHDSNSDNFVEVIGAEDFSPTHTYLNKDNPGQNNVSQSPVHQQAGGSPELVGPGLNCSTHDNDSLHQSLDEEFMNCPSNNGDIAVQTIHDSPSNSDGESKTSNSQCEFIGSNDEDRNDGVEELDGNTYVLKKRKAKTIKKRKGSQQKPTYTMMKNPELKKWLIPNPSNRNQCYCKYCEKVIQASNSNDLHNHGKSQNHLDAVEGMKSQVKLTDVRLKPSAASVKNKLKQDSRKLELEL